MRKSRREAESDVGLLAELVRVTSPPAGRAEISERGLQLIARALHASRGILVLESSEEGARTASFLGEGDRGRLEELASATAMRGNAGQPRLEVPGGTLLALAVPGDPGSLGALVLERGGGWDERACAFAAAAARVLSAALSASTTIVADRAQRQQLAQRNLELEILRELTERLLNQKSDEPMLQTALDLVLEKLGLEAGWVFGGESRRGRFDLVASRGVAPEFVETSRAGGVGRCLCAEVFETGRLLFARNTMECPRLPDLVRGSEPMTHACVPLRFERGVLGVMNIANRPGRIFTPQELQFLDTVGRQVCLAVDKAWTARSERRANAEARALASLARATGGGLHLDRVLQAVGEYARDLLAAERCAIFLGEGTPILRLAYLTGPAMEGLEVGVSTDFEALGARALAAAASVLRTQIFHDATQDPRANAELAGKWSVRGAILVPLVAHERVQGLLLSTVSRPHSWTPEQVDLANALGRQAAVAIENARLYQQAQDALLQLQAAQQGMVRAERLAAVGTLAASLAHEVRNPLNSINLHLVLLERRIAKLEESRQGPLLEHVATTRREIARLEALVQEFLTLSTVDRLALRETDLGEAVRDVLALLGPAARERGVRVRGELQAATPKVLLDREKFKQVLLNLTRNAIDAMPDGGTLSISSGTSDGRVWLRVTDTGVGIEPGLDVFDLFMSTKRDGTGLGLPIARRIVEAHGGSLAFESVVGEGTTFSISLKPV